MSKIIVTLSGSCSDQIEAETLAELKEDLEDDLRAAGASGVVVEIEVLS